MHTCPRRVEGPLDPENDVDSYTAEQWRYTNELLAAMGNQKESDARNEEARSLGRHAGDIPNLRYWLWPGPGPKPLICSYCGCLRPEDAFSLMRDHGFTVSRTTKLTKLYMHPPGWREESRALIEAVRAGGSVLDLSGIRKVEGIYPSLKLYLGHFLESTWSDLMVEASRF